MSEQQGEYRASLITSPAKRELVFAGEPDERFAVPTPGRFSTETLDAPDLAGIAAKLIGRREAFKHLASVDIDYLWKRKGGTKAGVPVLGACVRVSGIWQAFTDAQWVIWLAADNCQTFTNWLIQCNLIHQMLHAGEDENGPALVGHDYEGFTKELEWCGAWTAGLTVMTRAVSQLQLPMQGALPVTEAAGEDVPLAGTPLGEARPATLAEERELAAVQG